MKNANHSLNMEGGGEEKISSRNSKNFNYFLVFIGLGSVIIENAILDHTKMILRLKEISRKIILKSSKKL